MSRDEDICKVLMKDLITLLSKVHEKGFVHFDIKVDNILIGQGCKMLLCDGGLSSPINTMKNQRLQWRRMEKAWHIAPEIRSGSMLFHPAAADMYSAGALLVWMRV